jgi:hypothetical protein
MYTQRSNAAFHEAGAWCACSAAKAKKIGDGWRKGKWIPGLPSVKPQTWQEVVFPICWGSPQGLSRGREEEKPDHRRRARLLVSVSYRVDCRDRDTGADRADRHDHRYGANARSRRRRDRAGS